MGEGKAGGLGIRGGVAATGFAEAEGRVVTEGSQEVEQERLGLAFFIALSLAKSQNSRKAFPGRS